jgi:hypothetical protein
MERTEKLTETRDLTEAELALVAGGWYTCVTTETAFTSRTDCFPTLGPEGAAFRAMIVDTISRL